VLAPNGPHLGLGGEFAAGSSFLGRSNSPPLVVSESYRRRIIRAGKLKNYPRDIVLGVRWEPARDLDRLI
jgi:hypothetical protein